MKKFKSWILLIALTCIYIFLCAYNYVQAVSSNLKDNIFRLHVIANSDSIEDQNLKYIVRDNLLKYMNEICKETSNKSDAINIANQHKDDFLQIAKDTIKEEGYSYDVNVEIGEYDFPSKSYGDISIPSGKYDALKVKIGDSNGQNWWCVMFPPLCFIDLNTGIVPESSKQLLKDVLTDEEYALISDNSSDINFKFKLLELFSNSKLLTAKN